MHRAGRASVCAPELRKRRVEEFDKAIRYRAVAGRVGVDGLGAVVQGVPASGAGTRAGLLPGAEVERRKPVIVGQGLLLACLPLSGIGFLAEEEGDDRRRPAHRQEPTEAGFVARSADGRIEPLVVHGEFEEDDVGAPGVFGDPEIRPQGIGAARSAVAQLGPGAATRGFLLPPSAQEPEPSAGSGIGRRVA